MARHTTAREKRKARIRKKLTGTTGRPRLTVYRSLKHIYAQVVDDVTGRTLACAGSTSKALKDSNQEANKVAAASEESDKVVATSEESEKVVAAPEESDKVVAAPEEGKKAAAKDGKKTAAKEGKKAAAKAKEGKKVSAATRVGTAVAKAALEKGIKQVVFDRNGFDYHGRIAAVAEAARKAGLQF